MEIVHRQKVSKVCGGNSPHQGGHMVKRREVSQKTIVPHIIAKSFKARQRGVASDGGHVVSGCK